MTLSTELHKLRPQIENIQRAIQETTWFDDSKAGGSIAQQLGGMGLECIYILRYIDRKLQG